MQPLVPDEKAYPAVAELIAALPSGSYLAISHGVIDSFAKDQYNAVGAVYQRSTSRGGGLRDRDSIARFFDGLELEEPGLVWMSQWRGGELADVGPNPESISGLAGVARKPQITPRSSPGDDAWVDDEILEFQRAFDDAELRGDVERLGALLVDDFLSIGERGFVLDKEQWIGRHGDFRYLSIETSEVDVRRYDRTAILRCVQRSRATWRGELMTLATRVSQVWIEQPDGWRLAAIQFSTLAP